jgi:hypothetical protein
VSDRQSGPGVQRFDAVSDADGDPEDPVSEALSQALETIGRELERMVFDAEAELADARERCRLLETQVRSLAAALRPMAPEVTALLSRPVPAEPEALASVDKPAPVGAPDLAHEADPIMAADRSMPRAAPPAAQAPHLEDQESATGYMPMLEELWGIARDAPA